MPRRKSFPIQEDEHFLTVCRYVERNPLRAKLVERTEEWRWCSLWHRVQGGNVVSLDPWPVRAGKEWVAQVNRAETEAELKAVPRSVARGTPLGEDAWVQRTAQRLGLDSTLHSRGRPKKKPVKER